MAPAKAIPAVIKYLPAIGAVNLPVEVLNAPPMLWFVLVNGTTVAPVPIDVVVAALNET